MTNGEKYKKAFSVLQTSKGSLQEVENMAKLQKRTKMKTAAAVIAGCIILGGTGTAYAANVGGIQRTVQIWLHGDQTQATLDVSNDGTYTMEYYNEDGTLQQTGGGGVSIDADGTLSVLKNAQSGTVTVRATSKKNNVIYTDFNVSIVKLASQLVNGSFENVTDAMMPVSWISYDPDIDGEYNGVRRYRMNQTSETQLSNITRTNDDDGLVSGSYSTDSLGNTGLMFKGAEGIDKDYEGFVYAHNANNSSLDGGPDIRVTSGITYWVSQDYRMENFYQLNDSAVVGPYMSYEGFQGTTSKKSKFSRTWYFKDGNPTTPYTTDGYDTLTNQITVPADVNRLRINWGLKASEGNIFYSNFRIAPQGIDTSKTAVDGE